MATLRDRPYSRANFLVDMGDGDASSLQAGVDEVVFPEARIQVVEYRDGNDKENDPRKVTTQSDYTNLILKRASHGSLNWYQWWNTVRNGDQTALRTVSIQLQAEDRTLVAMTWRFLRARPVAHHFAPLISRDNDVVVETLELAVERVEME